MLRLITSDRQGLFELFSHRQRLSFRFRSQRSKFRIHGFAYSVRVNLQTNLPCKGLIEGTHVNRAPKKHISKNKDRDIPYNPPYNEAQ